MNEYYKIEEICKVKGGKRIPQGCTLQDAPNEHPYIRILDMYQGRILNISDEMQYAKEEYWSIIKNYIVKKGDVIYSGSVVKTQIQSFYNELIYVVEEGEGCSPYAA